MTAQTLIPSAQTLVGSMLRLPLKLVPRDAVVPILSGPARGFRWIVGSSTHGCWLGTYEKAKQARFAGAIGPGDVVYDLGAQAGVYSLIASRRVAPPGAVYAFEPLPRNIGFLQRHIELNAASNITVVEVALSDIEGNARFADGPNSLQGSLDERGQRVVRAASLDALLAQRYLRPPNAMKIDIEGGGLRACLGAKETLRLYKPVIFLAIDAASDYECCQFLQTLGYKIEEFAANEVVATA